MKNLHWVDEFVYLGRKFTTEGGMDGKMLGSTNVSSKVDGGWFCEEWMKEK